MNTDLSLVLGTVLLVLSIPSAVGAYSDGRPPRVAAFAILVATILIVLAASEAPGRFRLTNIPDAFIRLIGAWLR